MNERIVGYQTNKLKFVSSGVCPNCTECCESFGYDSMDEFNQGVENGDIFDEGSFSWSPCDECSTSLGGSSYYAHGIDENGDLVHFRICNDCLMEFNGYKWNEKLECYE